MIEVHITADRHFWTGASTLAALGASAAKRAVVVSAGDDDIRRRFLSRQLTVEPCGMRGPFASLNLARAMRRLPPSPLKIFIHSPSVADKVARALELLGRQEPVTLAPAGDWPEFPRHTPRGADPSMPPTFLWVGNITDDCGLLPLLELMATHLERPWRLRVVGHGKGRTVGPILRRTRALGIAGRIDWRGYQTDPYGEMDDITAAILTHPRGPESVVAHEYNAASLKILTYESFDNQWPQP